MYISICVVPFFFLAPVGLTQQMPKTSPFFFCCCCLCSSPDNDAAKQNELDKYFMQTALPSPWPASAQSRPAKTAPPTRPPKHVSFNPPTTTCKSYSKLPSFVAVYGGGRERGSNTVLTLYGSQHIPLYVLCC